MIGWEHMPSGAGMLGHAEGGQQAAISEIGKSRNREIPELLKYLFVRNLETVLEILNS
jgi:hypothetical protein